MTEEVVRELDHLVTRALQNRARSGSLDLEAVEMAVRASMHRIGATLLGQILNADGGDHRGTRIDCGCGQQAEFVGYRDKKLATVLGAVGLRRAYYGCAACKTGMVPKDAALDVVATSFSPGVRRMMARLGGKEPFDQGREDLEELAGLQVKTKQVERVAEATGEQVRRRAAAEVEAAFAGTLVGLARVPRMYLAIDGTGVPMVACELAGRAGKDPATGQAKTREAKLGALFTQTGVDEHGHPVRDDGSTSYVGAIETAAVFGRRIYAEAVRRGLHRAGEIVVLGDGAPWIWNLAGEHFPQAVEILDLYHAREHVSEIGKLLYGAGTKEAKHWAAKHYQQLDDGRVETLIRALERLPADTTETQENLRRAIAYFETNTHRMRYDRFRRRGLFVGSGVVEAGCKTIIGQRLKQSGMHWTLRGANQIIALRCCQLSGRWEDFWLQRACA